MDIVNQVLVLFLLILCGFVAAKAKCIREEGVHGLNSMLVNFSLPCMAIAKLQVDASPELMQDIVHMAILTAVTMLGCAAVVWFGICRHEPPLRRAALSGLALIPNSGFMGLPLIAAAFGEDKMIYGIIYVGVSNIITWSVGVALYDKKALSWRRIFLIPTLVTSVLGLILFVAEVRLPSVLLDTLEMLGDTTTPLAMFIIGTHLVGLRLRDMRDAKLLLIWPAADRLPAGGLRPVPAAGRIAVDEWLHDAPYGHALRLRAGHPGGGLPWRSGAGLSRRGDQHVPVHRHHTAAVAPALSGESEASHRGHALRWEAFSLP